MTNIPASQWDNLIEDIRSAVLYWMGKSTAPHAHLFDVDAVIFEVEHRLRSSHAEGVHRWGDYVLVWGTFTPWYSTGEVFVEDLLIRVDRTGDVSLDRVISNIRELAKEQGLSDVFVGDTQGIGYMTEQYIKGGFEPIGSVLYRRI